MATTKTSNDANNIFAISHKKFQENENINLDLILLKMVLN